MMIKIKCPKCGRVLGDTEKSLDANMNCHRCKSVHIRIKVYDHSKYLPNKKGER